MITIYNYLVVVSHLHLYLLLKTNACTTHCKGNTSWNMGMRRGVIISRHYTCIYVPDVKVSGVIYLSGRFCSVTYTLCSMINRV